MNINVVIHFFTDVERGQSLASTENNSEELTSDGETSIPPELNGGEKSSDTEEECDRNSVDEDIEILFEENSHHGKWFLFFSQFFNFTIRENKIKTKINIPTYY